MIGSGVGMAGIHKYFSVYGALRYLYGPKSDWGKVCLSQLGRVSWTESTQPV